MIAPEAGEAGRLLASGLAPRPVGSSFGRNSVHAAVGPALHLPSAGGALTDPARRFISEPALRRFIGVPAMLKLNVLQLHHADDPVPPEFNPEEARRILGAQGQLWGE